MCCLLCVVLFGVDTQPTEAEKWIGPVLTSCASLVAACFAYLTARDRLKYDAVQAIQNDKIKNQGERIGELEKEVVLCHQDRARLGKRVGRVMANLQAQSLGRTLPFPDEHGFSTDEDTNN